VAWEGDDYPENEGWEREGTGDRSVRSLADGVMTMDSLNNVSGQDYYSAYGAPDPAPGEELVVQWRARVNEIEWDNPNFRYDPGWSLNTADGWFVAFVLGIDELHDLMQQVDTPFVARAYHAWELRSGNLRTFNVWLDGDLVSTGEFVLTLPGASVQWGDFVWGPTSSVDWDYFRFGVVPEPPVLSSVVLFFLSFSRQIPNRGLR
jgi:hypothetical protein